MNTVLERGPSPPAVARRAGKFGLVGIAGLLVNLVVQAGLTEWLGLNYLASAIIATQCSSIFNFTLSERWVFQGDGARIGQRARFASFMAMNNLALLLRTPMMWMMVDLFGVHYTIANLVSLAVLTLVRFGVADRLIWGSTTEAPIEDAQDVVAPRPAGPSLVTRLRRAAARHGWMIAILAGGVWLRLWKLMAVGLNSDEVVYASQAAGIAGDSAVTRFFPIFRAHPFLFQALLSLPFQFGTNDVAGRLLSVAFGLATIIVVARLGTLLYGRRAGLLAAAIVAVMPYHVIITRQILLDGPMTFFATLSLYFMARFAHDRRAAWLYAAAAGLGLTTLAKETYIILIGSAFVFLVLNPEIRLRLRDLAVAGAIFVATLLVHPLTVALAGQTKKGSSYLAWQLFRRPNHGFTFYFATLPPVIGWLVLLFAATALWAGRGRLRTWRERLLLAWIVVPAGFLTIWPVKGFHYLLAAAMPVAVLAGHGIVRSVERVGQRWRLARFAIPAVVLLSLAVPSWLAAQPPTSKSFMAGTGGVPGGREVGRWVATHTPEGSQLMTVGPSMANIIQWYGHRQARGLSVSPNPLNRNPSYEPIVNPDRAIRTNELQYVVWDSYSTSRSGFFGNKLLAYADRYHGREVFVYESGGHAVIRVFEVRP